jgi:hypothetical protein
MQHITELGLPSFPLAVSKPRPDPHYVTITTHLRKSTLLLRKIGVKRITDDSHFDEQETDIFFRLLEPLDISEAISPLIAAHHINELFALQLVLQTSMDSGMLC